MSGGRRVQRLNAQLQREISQQLRRDVRDPRVSGVTIARVSITSDLSIARVFVRTLSGEDLKKVLKGLTAAAPFLRRGLAAVLTMRRVPELEFLEDRSLEQAMRIESLLDEVRPDGGWEESADEEAPSGESVAEELDGDADD